MGQKNDTKKQLRGRAIVERQHFFSAKVAKEEVFQVMSIEGRP